MNVIDTKDTGICAMTEDEDGPQGCTKMPWGGKFPLKIGGNTHILDFLDERIFPLKDHKKQLSTFFGRWPLVNVVNHAGLGREERKQCYTASASLPGQGHREGEGS